MRGIGRLFGRDRSDSAVPLDAGDLPAVEETKACRHCGGQVSRGATVCLHCERDLSAVMPRGQFIRLFGAPEASATSEEFAVREPSEEE